MQIACPACRTRFRLDERKFSGTIPALRCSKCRTLFRIDGESAAGSSDAPAEMPPTGRITVLVAHESPAFCAEVEKVLASEPFTVLSCHDGKEALAAIDRLLPRVVLVDVALPSMFGFQVCEAVRSNPRTAGVKLILIAAIYDKTKYKRSPQSLYGADDYIEKHHIPDALAGMIYRLAAEAGPADCGEEPANPQQTRIVAPHELSAAEVAIQEESRKSLRDDEARTTALLLDSADDGELHDQARRLARRIISDISLYRQAEVEEGISSGTFYQLLADAISDGRKLYDSRIPETVRSGTNYLDEAFAEFITRKQHERINKNN